MSDDLNNSTQDFCCGTNPHQIWCSFSRHYHWKHTAKHIADLKAQLAERDSRVWLSPLVCGDHGEQSTPACWDCYEELGNHLDRSQAQVSELTAALKKTEAERDALKPDAHCWRTYTVELNRAELAHNLFAEKAARERAEQEVVRLSAELAELPCACREFNHNHCAPCVARMEIEDERGALEG